MNTMLFLYATSADVLQKFNAALTKYNIWSVATPALSSDIEIVTNKGNKEHLVTVKMDTILTDADSGEAVTITGLASGQDNGDKAVMKAQTTSIKYAYLFPWQLPPATIRKPITRRMRSRETGKMQVRHLSVKIAPGKLFAMDAVRRYPKG
jgi:hypothetical protein